MRNLRARLAAAPVGLRLASLVVLPLAVVGWWAGARVAAVQETRAGLAGLEETADELVLLGDLQSALTEQQLLSQIEAIADRMGVPVVMVEPLTGIDLLGMQAETDERIDELVGALGSADIAAGVEAARAEGFDPEAGVAPGFVELSLTLRAAAAERAGEVAALSSTPGGGEELVQRARAVERSNELRTVWASGMADGYRYQLRLRPMAPEDVEGLLAVSQLHSRLSGDLETLVDDGTSAQAALDALVADPAVATLLEESSAADGSLSPILGDDESLDSIPVGRIVELVDLYGAQLDHADNLHKELIDASQRDLVAAVADLRSEADEELVRAVGTTIVVLLVTIGLLYGASGSIARPAHRLGTAAGDLLSGVQSDPIPMTGPSEFRRAAAALNEAVHHLELVERQALALADGDLDDEAFASPAPGRLGASLSAAVERLRRSIAEREEYRVRLAHEAAHDALTGLPNRAACFTQLTRALARIQRSEGSVGVLFIDLDGFKEVNDRYGHATGDAHLKEVADRLSDAVRGGDLVGRIGGDEFLVVAEPIGGPHEALELAHRLQRAISQPIAGHPVVPSASIGVALSSDNLGADEIVHDADIAVYQAKSHGRGQAVLCDDGLRAQVREDSTLTDAVHSAVEHDELELHYQTAVDAVSGTPAVVEALVRWNRPGHGLVMPDEFVPFAERSDLIVDVDRWVIDEAVRHAVSWADDPQLAACDLAVNVSDRSLANGDFLGELSKALDRSGLDASKLIIEITERTLVDEIDTIGDRLIALRALGVRVAIDDFGTGSTSIAQLQRLPVDIVKIDRSFTANLDDAEGRALVKLMVDTGHLLGLAVTADGVETPGQAETLEALGADTLQGGYSGQPVASAELVPGSNQAR